MQVNTHTHTHKSVFKTTILTHSFEEYFYEGFLRVSSFKSNCQRKWFWIYPVKNKYLTQNIKFSQIKHNQENIGMK